MSEQMELFPDFGGPGLSIQKRVQLGFLMELPDHCVDDYLILDAWHRDTGYDLVAMAEQHLQTRLGFTSPSELMKSLRDRKFGEFIGARANRSQKKLTDLSVRPDRGDARLFTAGSKHQS